jgi:flagellar basal body-associated protein FliL
MAGNTEQKKAGNETPATAPPAPSGGLKAMLPLIVTIVLMPVLAFVMTNYVLLPKLTVAAGRAAPGGEHGTVPEHSGESGAGEHGAPAESAHGGDHGETAPLKSAKGKTRVAMGKLVVNVAGSLGSRLLLCSITLVGTASDFKSAVESNDDMLRDLASSVLASKTISDLEKPDARNLIRAELMSQFNASLRRGLVEEIYITELAIQ